MKTLISCLFFLTFVIQARGQSFVKDFFDFRQSEINPSGKKRVAATLKRYNRNLKKELFKVFTRYQADTGFDFDTYDSVFVALICPAEAPFFCEVIVWSGNDTVSFEQQMNNNSKGKPVRSIRPTNRRDYFETNVAYQAITELDSVMNLIQGRDFHAIHDLGKGQSVMDGVNYSLYLAIRSSKDYEIISIHPEKFFLPVTYRKL